MSLYQVQKVLFDVNRNPANLDRFINDFDRFIRAYDLTEDERDALRKRDIGRIYVMGVNCQILMFLAGALGIAWSDYLQLMRDGVRLHGPVQAGVYAMTTSVDEKVAGL